MSKQVEIEQALQRIDQTRFQRLVSHYLSLNENTPYFSPGTVIGQDKTSKGSPDSFSLLPNGTFSFKEYTTLKRTDNKTKFFNKLVDDIDHCFNENETKIPAKDISRIILAFTSKITASEVSKLLKKVRNYNEKCTFETLGIEELSAKLLLYPGIVSIHLSIPIDSGQIFYLNDYIERSDTGIQPSLKNQFKFRDQEQTELTNKLDRKNIIILTGIPGVGKTKLACNFLDSYRVNDNGTIPLVISSNGATNIWDDLNKFILPGKKYIILFDDANRVSTSFDEILNFYKIRNLDMKILVTVRDYAGKKIRDQLAIANIDYDELELKRFQDSEIKVIANSVLEGKYFRPEVQDIITTMAKGNARIALMAAKVAKKDGLNSLLGSHQLYQSYFSPMIAEMALLSDKSILSALALVSFFGLLYKNHEQTKILVETGTGLNYTEVWDKLLVLSRHELVDIYEGEIAKVSDQVLASYAFYSVFIDATEKALSYEQLIKSTLLSHSYRLSDTLYDAINSFTYKTVKDSINTALININNLVNDHEEALDLYYDTFWYLRESATLKYLKEKISILEKPNEAKYTFTYKHNDLVGKKDQILTKLSNFWASPSDNLKLSLALALEYVLKRPELTPMLLYKINENFAFTTFDYRFSYKRQHELLDFLISSGSKRKENKILDNILLEIAPKFLNTFYRSQGTTTQKLQIHFTNFHLTANESLFLFRKRLIIKILTLYSQYEEKVYVFLNKYIHPGQNFQYSLWEGEIALFDSFIKRNINVSDFKISKFVYDFVLKLNSKSIKYPKAWNKAYSNYLFEVSMLFDSRTDNKLEIDIEKQIENKAQQLNKYFDKVLSKKNTSIFSYLEEMVNTNHNFNNYLIGLTFTQFFKLKVEEDPELFYRLLEFYIKRGAKFGGLQSLIAFCVKSNNIKIDKLYSLLNKYEFPDKINWKYEFLTNIPENSVNQYYLNELIDFYKNTPGNINVYSLHFLKNYNDIYTANKPKIRGASKYKYAELFITATLLQRKIGKTLFGPSTISGLKNVFENDIALAKKVYKYAKDFDDHYDYDGSELKQLMLWDNNFLSEYISGIEGSKYLFSLDSLKLSFIWEMDLTFKIIDSILDVIIQRSYTFQNFEKASALFDELEPDSKEKAIIFLNKYLKKHSKSKKHMLLLMNIITYSFSDQIITWFIKIIQNYKKMDFMNSVMIEKNEVIQGSRIPVLESHIELYEKIISKIRNLPDVIDYTEHIDYLTNVISGFNRDIKSEREYEFADLY
jgi:hypothetical protein